MATKLSIVTFYLYADLQTRAVSTVLNESKSNPSDFACPDITVLVAAAVWRKPAHRCPLRPPPLLHLVRKSRRLHRGAAALIPTRGSTHGANCLHSSLAPSQLRSAEKRALPRTRYGPGTRTRAAQGASARDDSDEADRTRGSCHVLGGDACLRDHGDHGALAARDSRPRELVWRADRQRRSAAAPQRRASE
jgi:hypothetical protein